MPPDAAHTTALTIPAADLAPLLDMPQMADAAPAVVLAQFGLTRARLATEPDARLALGDYFRLWQAMKRVSQDETQYLSARPLIAGTTDFVISDAARMATLADAMERLAQAYNLLHGGDYNRVERRGLALTYLVDDGGFPYTQASDTYIQLCLEGVLLFLHATFCMLAGEDLTWALRRAQSRRPAPRAETPLALWNIPVRYGAGGYGLTYDAAVARLPLVEGQGLPSDDATHQRLIALIESRRSGDAGGDLAGTVRRALGDGLQDQAAMARRLGVSVATLRRGLAAEGASFRRLRGEALNESAKQRLAHAANIGDVAEALGFSDCRSFTRAFKAWNGVTPSHWRAGGRA